MTGVAPPASMPASPAPRSSARPAVATEGEGDFAGLLADMAAGRGEVGAKADGEGRSALALAVAHVFNAFGFFPAGAAGPSGPPAARISPASAQAVDEPEPEHAATRSTVPSAAASRNPDLAAAGAEPAAKGEISVNVDPGLPAAAGELRAEAHFPGPGTAPRKAPVERLAAPRAQASGEGLPVAGRPAERSQDAPVAGRRGLSGTRPVLQHSEASAERLVFRIAEHCVELAGRLPGLSDDERQRLMDALADVLRGHGLSLASATLNGRPLSAAPVQGNS